MLRSRIDMLETLQHHRSLVSAPADAPAKDVSFS
jgi:hypothetical protein